jgi:hypothetical protein
LRPLPAWRRDNIRQLRLLYPGARLVYRFAKSQDPTHDSDNWRLKMCGRYKRCLWVDSDVWLNSWLPLTEVPAMADEYGVRHWSIMWTGEHPEVFASVDKIGDLAHDWRIEKMAIPGRHYIMAPDGSRTDKRR